MIHLSSTSPVPTPVILGERLEQFAKRLNLLASISATQNYFSLWASFSLLERFFKKVSPFENSLGVEPEP
jgi:hypothetical protein